MKTVLICLAVMLFCFGMYVYVHDTTDSMKLWSIVRSMVSTMTPIKLVPEPPTPVLPLITGKLVTASGAPYDFPASAPAASIQYFGIYYASKSSAPSQSFTPVLVDWYTKFKLNHPNFEIIFVSEDPDEPTMLGYMKSTGMPWLAVRYGELKHDGTYKGSDIEKFAGAGIPDLVLVDASGRILSDSFSGKGDYVGPHQVMADTEKLVPVGQVADTVSTAARKILSAIKVWTPPQPFPAQPNWSWTTVDGKTYDNVAITAIDPDEVSITHSLGVAHLPISLLQPDLQKQLKYDADAADFAATQRKTPLYPLTSIVDAEAASQHYHRPIAWVAGPPNLQTSTDSMPGVALTRMALTYLKQRAIAVYLDDPSEITSLPDAIRDQFNTEDDGPQPGGRHFVVPKIVVSSADAATIFGRVSETQMSTDREASLDAVFSPPPPGSQPTPPPATELAAKPVPVWTAPAVIPSQANWTWTTSEGKTYQNVVINEIGPDTVSIQHSLGAGRVDIATLPPDIQKQLNYDPAAAEAARVETQREADHPYYVFADASQAESMARQLHRPLAWMDSRLEDMSASPVDNTEADLTQMAVEHLKSRAVIIFGGPDDLGKMPPVVVGQFFVLDDGPMPGGHHFYGPKIVFSDPDVTKALGRCSFTQMKAGREVALDLVLDNIRHDAAAQAQVAATSDPATAPTPSVATAPAPSPSASAPAQPQPAAAPAAPPQTAAQGATAPP